MEKLRKKHQDYIKIYHWKNIDQKKLKLNNEIKDLRKQSAAKSYFFFLL